MQGGACMRPDAGAARRAKAGRCPRAPAPGTPRADASPRVGDAAVTAPAPGAPRWRWRTSQGLCRKRVDKRIVLPVRLRARLCCCRPRPLPLIRRPPWPHGQSPPGCVAAQRVCARGPCSAKLGDFKHFLKTGDGLGSSSHHLYCKCSLQQKRLQIEWQRLFGNFRSRRSQIAGHCFQ
jgi:hypothetical protein